MPRKYLTNISYILNLYVDSWTIPNPKIQKTFDSTKPYSLKTTTKNSGEMIRDHQIMLFVLEQFQI